ncbi:hypothetical protein ASZ90_010402 [hydrocarbon metagenome]|uniref:histidine kinase n=1 Tax=hydrocarbon metagenome TaxID=938273 RepID=A0A0W8FG37_9ZZZZ
MRSPLKPSADYGPALHILDLLDGGVLLVGPDNRIAWINRALQQLLEVEPDALFGIDAGEFARRFLLPRIVEDECRQAISRSLQDRTEVPGLFCTIRTADGKERYIRYSSRTGEEEPPPGVRLVRLQDAPRQGGEQEMLATILSYLPETVNILDRGLRYVHVDREFAEKLGLQPHEMVGKTWEELGFTMEGAGPYFEKVREVFATGRSVRGEVRHVVIEGTEYSEYISVPIPGPSGRVDRVLTVSRDITDRKRAERELAHKHELLQTIIDTIPVMITIYDPNLKTFRFNRELRDTLGWTDEDASAGDFMAMCYPDPGYREMVGRFMQSLEPGWRDVVLTAKDGSLVESSWANVRLSDDTRVGIGIDIRGRKAGEKALRESEERFRGIYERAGIGIALVGLDGRITDANPAIQKMLGYRPDQLCGRHFADITHPDDVAEDVALVTTLVAGEIDTYRIEKRYVTADGQILWGLLTASLIRSPEGIPQSIIGMVEDISDRKRVEDALRESEERYRSLVDVMPDAVAVHRDDGTIVYVNPAGVQIAGGKGPEEIVGKSIDVFVHPECRDFVTERFRQILQEGTAIPVFEQVLLTTAGQTLWVDITATPILYDGQRSIMVVFRDTTERKQAEEALFLAKEYNRALIEASIDPLATIDAEGRITDVNAAAEQVTGFTRDELIGTEFSGYTTEPDRARAGARKALMDGELRDFPLEIRHRDGRTTPALLNASVYRDGQGRVAGIFAAARDITERKQAEAALRQQTEELTRVNRELEEAHREANLYLDILTHDVRNANNVSMMYADLMLDLLEGELATYAQKLHDSIRRSTEILKNVATIRRIHLESAELSPVDLDAVIREEIRSFPAASIRYDGQPVTVCADGLLPMVFTNLIGNAAKFGGPDAEIAVQVEDRDGEVLVSVEDAGPGIPDDVKALLFRRFERGLGHGRGEGLGLYIVRMLAERYGGRVFVDDRIPGRPNLGAAFRFTLAKVPQGGAAAERTAPPAGEGNPAGRHDTRCGYIRSILDLVKDAVLVADDAGHLREINRAACTLLGYTREELLQRSVFDICADREETGREFWRGFLERGVLQGECELARKDGATIRVECNAVAEIAPGIHVATIRPLPGQTQVEEILQFERDQLLSIFDGLEAIVYVTDPVTHEILYANPFFTRMLGKRVVGGLCYREFQALDAPCPFCTDAIILRQKPKPYRWEYYNPILDVHLDIVDRIIRWPDGRDVRLEVAIDITDRKRTELALQESEEQFRALLNATPDATILIDRDGTVLALNEAMAAPFGKDAEEIRGTCVYDLFPPDLAAVRKKSVDAAFSSGRPLTVTDEHKGRIFEHILYPIRSAGGYPERLAIVSADVTDRKQVEQIRREAFDRIERNMEQFAILADHVRHPLQVILARTDLMDDRETAEQLREQVRRIDDLIKQLDRGWVESRKIREYLQRHDMA